MANTGMIRDLISLALLWGAWWSVVSGLRVVGLDWLASWVHGAGLWILALVMLWVAVSGVKPQGVTSGTQGGGHKSG